MNYIVHLGTIQTDFYKFCNKTYTKNGCMYDPALGRFRSPDPFMQDPSNTQNFNRYSYCLNNPLKFIDPSGFVYSGATSHSYYTSPAYPVIYGNYGGASLNTRSKKSGIYIDGEFIPCNNFFVSMVGGAENIENVQQDGHIAWDSQNFDYEIGGRLTGNFYERGLWTQVASNWTNQYRIGMVGSKNFVCGMAGEVIWTFTSYKDLNYTFNEFFKPYKGQLEFSFDKDKAVDVLNSRALERSKKRCGLYVGIAIQGGGLKIPIQNAFNYKNVLPNFGFREVGITDYSPKKGDVVVFDRNSYHIWGHVAMYNGNQWVSDFKQGYIGINQNYPNAGSGFIVYPRNCPPFTLFRY